MQAYYDGLAELRRHLEAAGARDIASRLLAAERGGCTAGEILAQTGVLLRRLLDSQEADHPHLRDEVEALDRLGSELWRIYYATP